MNYHNKIFRPISNNANGETSEQTVFHYKQTGQIQKGHLIGLVDELGNIDMRYHQVNVNGELMTGTCQSTPEILPDGKIRLHERWEWTSVDKSKGTSIIEEQ